MRYYGALVKKTVLSLAIIGIGAFVIPAARAGTKELITNGGFETEDFTGWTVTNEARGEGLWFIRFDGFTRTHLPTVGPASGFDFALADESGPGSYVLEQNITVDPGSSSVIFTFDQFVNDWTTALPTPGANLDYTYGHKQHATVSLLNAGADPFSVSPTDVLATFYDGVDVPYVTNPYTAYSFDITNLVQAGGAFTIRFAQTSNELEMNTGVDNVSVLETSGAVTPEPAAGLDLGVGLVGICGLLLVRSRKVQKSVL